MPTYNSNSSDTQHLGRILHKVTVTLLTIFKPILYELNLLTDQSEIHKMDARVNQYDGNVLNSAAGLYMP